MTAALVLAHGLIGLLAVLSSRVQAPQRSRFMQGLAVAGGAIALVLFFAAQWLGDWRTLEVTRPGARIAGIAIGAAWILVAVTERSRGGGRWDVVASTGVGATALAMYSLNEWTVPALLFAGIAALAAALASGGGVAAGLIGAGATLVAGALVGHVLVAETWRLPLPLHGSQLWLAVAGAGAFALAAVVLHSSDRPSSATPLALGLAFVTLSSVARGAGPVVALVVLLLALVAVIRTLTKESVAQRVVIEWVVAVTFALGAISANLYVTTRSAVAGVLAATAIRLWPLSLGRAQIERGILVAFVAVTAGFNAIAAAASYAFARSTAIESVVYAAPWAGISALLPVALAGGVILGASVGRNPEPDDYTRSGVLGSWALVILSIVVGVFPYIGESPRGAGPGVALYVVAVIAGLAAARYAPRLGAVAAVPTTDSRFLEVPLALPWPRTAVVATRAVALVTAGLILAATYQGLRVGFL